ncbi:MAG TPA: YlxR family protein, partial [Bacilli bacterium]
GKVSCFKLAKKTRALDKALKHKVDDHIYDRLAQDFVRVEDDFLSAAEAGGQEAENGS